MSQEEQEQQEEQEEQPPPKLEFDTKDQVLLVTMLILGEILLPKLKNLLLCSMFLVMIYLLVRNYIVLPERPSAWHEVFCQTPV